MIKNMKYKLSLMSILFLALIYSCNDYLEVPSLTKMSAEKLLSDEKGLKTLLANLYKRIPMEDFNYRPDDGFNVNGWGSGAGGMRVLPMYTDEAVKSDGDTGVGPGGTDYWTLGYGQSRDIAIFLKSITQIKDAGKITEAQFNRLWSEAHFLRAYTYFGLAKRIGGVPILDWVLDDDYDGDAEVLFHPRNTELETWKFILDQCDKAVLYLPTADEFSSSDGSPKFRATKWAAYALKSRVALYAASLAKYGDRATFTGEAVQKQLVGIAPSEASFFYNECISASLQIINNSKHSLYKPSPANVAEAALNYQYIFLNHPAEEVILARAYQDGTVVGSHQGHDYDVRYSPSQASTGFHKWGRFSPTIDLVDLYEDYKDNGSGDSAPIVTRTDGIENAYISSMSPTTSQVANIPFVKYSDPYEPFKNKDARLFGSIIVPGAEFKGIKIVMQGGLIRKDGTLVMYTPGSEVGQDGKTYYTYGAESPGGYSGFATMTSNDDANFSTTGFTLRKFLAENKTIKGMERSSYNSWIDFRLAEVYLNYAEAVVENNAGDRALAAKLINDLRKRAAHTDNIPLTLDNVMKERRIELAFENLRMWDLFRRREYHTLFDNYRRHALVQLVDLREPTPKYIFLRMENFHDVQAGGRTFQTNNYYRGIPGTGTNRLINNPGR